MPRAGEAAVKMSMELTLDGLLRGLRAEAHRLADELEAGYGRDAPGEHKRRLVLTDGSDESEDSRDDDAGR